MIHYGVISFMFGKAAAVIGGRRRIEPARLRRDALGIARRLSQDAPHPGAVFGVRTDTNSETSNTASRTIDVTRLRYDTCTATS